MKLSLVMFSITSRYNFISSSLAEQSIFNSDKREVVDYPWDIKTRIQRVDAFILLARTGKF